MAAQGTAHQGKDSVIAERVYISGTDLTLIAYTNTADSLTESSTYATLTEPLSTNGYAPLVLDGTWASTDGVVTYTHSSVLVAANPALTGWSATGIWSASVTGVAIVNGTSHLLHWKDLGTSFVAADGKKLGVDLTNVFVP